MIDYLSRLAGRGPQQKKVQIQLQKFRHSADLLIVLSVDGGRAGSPKEASTEESPALDRAFHLERKGGPVMVVMLIKLSVRLLGQLLIVVLWPPKAKK